MLRFRKGEIVRTASVFGRARLPLRSRTRHPPTSGSKIPGRIPLSLANQKCVMAGFGDQRLAAAPLSTPAGDLPFNWELFFCREVLQPACAFKTTTLLTSTGR